jgi:carbon starvation protein
MLQPLLASLFTETENGRTLVRAMPVLLGVLCIMAIAYRYYSAFLAAKVAALNDANATPAHRFNDGQNYHPTNKWVLFGHHFAAISGAGPLIGPVLALHFGYAPSLLWLLTGVCLAGAVQDMLVLAASVRRDGKSLAQIALAELGKSAAVITSLAILFIVVIALAGLGIVVVKALGGEDVKMPEGMQVQLPAGQKYVQVLENVNSPAQAAVVMFPPGCDVRYSTGAPPVHRSEATTIRIKGKTALADAAQVEPGSLVTIPVTSVQKIPGSSWGTFTIICTIPIALFVALWMYRIRKGKVLEASLIGAVGVLAATVIGAWIPETPQLRELFSWDRDTTIFALCGYGFVASVLPVWLLLCPRDYISSFLKIGTIALLIVGTIVANPTLKAPPFNEDFANGSPVFGGSLFPFMFICIMCGAISGFHALVSSGTTPKMIDKESQIRPIGYGAMLMEGLVGVVALIAAASLPPNLYDDMNIDIEKAKSPALQEQLKARYERLGIDLKAAADPLHATGVGTIGHLDVEKANLGQIEQLVGGESLRGRTGGAPTLAVGMARIFTKAMSNTGLNVTGAMKYWYHFAIMFEALFILTTIDTGTRIGRFLLQEALGKLHPRFEKTDWLPGALLATFVITAGWGTLVWTGSIDTIWPMFGIANQLLAVMALALVTTWLVNSGRGRYAWATVLPMLFVTATTMTAGANMLLIQFPARFMSAANPQPLKFYLNLSMTAFVMISVGTLLLMAASRWVAVWFGVIPPRRPAV